MIADLILALAGIYVALGIAFAAVFVTRGIDKVDPAAAATGKTFRLIVTPGVIALWPVLLRRWKEARL